MAHSTHHPPLPPPRRPLTGSNTQIRSQNEENIHGLGQAPLSYIKLCKEVYAKVGLHQLDCDECVFVKYSQNIIDA
jgi:hypothetical protein